jgi:heme/copper-type cytochrome/quinol oxidase subunit 3
MYTRAHEVLNVPLATVNTMVLIGSSVTMVMSWASLMMNDFSKFKMYLGITILLAFVFLVVKGFEYADKFSHGYAPGSNNFLGIYFTLTGLHAIHVIGGIVVNGYLWGPGSKMWKTDPKRFVNRIEVAGLYWHFVDLVWIFLFPTIYLL